MYILYSKWLNNIYLNDHRLEQRADLTYEQIFPPVVVDIHFKTLETLAYTPGNLGEDEQPFPQDITPTKIGL